MGLAAVTGDAASPPGSAFPYTHRASYYVASWWVRKLAGETFLFHLPRVIAPIPNYYVTVAGRLGITNHAETISEGPAWAQSGTHYGGAAGGVSLLWSGPTWQFTVGALKYEVPFWDIEVEHLTAQFANELDIFSTVLFARPSLSDFERGFRTAPTPRRPSLLRRLIGK